MTLPDSLLSADAPKLALCMYLDVQGDPFRYAFALCDQTPPTSTILPTADPDFDGQTFSTADPRILGLSPVTNQYGGVEAVQFILSGSLQLDSAIINALADPAKFRGRTAKVWKVLQSNDFQPLHAQQVFGGFMTTLRIEIGPDFQRIVLTAEMWARLRSGGSPNRTLLSQQLYDPGDLSAAATLGTANSGSALGIATAAGGGPGAGLEPWLDFNISFR